MSLTKISASSIIIPCLLTKKTPLPGRFRIIPLTSSKVGSKTYTGKCNAKTNISTQDTSSLTGAWISIPNGDFRWT